MAKILHNARRKNVILGWLAGTLVAALLQTSALAAEPAKLKFSGLEWTVKHGPKMGPGPNAWDRRNVWVDDEGRLHLKMAQCDGKWTSPKSRPLSDCTSARMSSRRSAGLISSTRILCWVCSTIRRPMLVRAPRTKSTSSSPAGAMPMLPSATSPSGQPRMNSSNPRTHSTSISAVVTPRIALTGSARPYRVYQRPRPDRRCRTAHR